MPAIHYRLRWPDATVTLCYSPSLVIQDYLLEGERYPLHDFLERLRAATRIADDRVRAKFGFSCSQVKDQLAESEAHAARFAAQDGASVEVIGFEAP